MKGQRRPSSLSCRTRGLVQSAGLSSPPTWRRIAVSSFIAFHLSALAWWNLGVIDYRTAHARRPGDWYAKLQGAAETVDPSGTVRDTLVAYMRGTGMWQRWILFGPDAPHATGHVQVWGIVGFDAAGQPVVDPEPLHDSLDPNVTDHTRLIGNPPCGFDRSDHPLAVYIRRAFAQMHAREAAAARGTIYVGVQLSCLTRPLPPPGEDPDGPQPVPDILWAGPVDASSKQGPR